MEMAILVICTITHFYTVSHLALTSLKQIDNEFEHIKLLFSITKKFLNLLHDHWIDKNICIANVTITGFSFAEDVINKLY